MRNRAQEKLDLERRNHATRARIADQTEKDRKNRLEKKQARIVRNNAKIAKRWS